jgi:hypothetical protein
MEEMTGDEMRALIFEVAEAEKKKKESEKNGRY